MTVPDRSERPYAAGLLVLTAATGAVDGVSFVALDKVFTGNMTGNVLFIGFGLVGVENIPVVNNLAALACFLSGAVTGARVTRRSVGLARLPRSSLLLITGNVTAMFVIALAWLAVGTLQPPLELIVTGILAFLLGGQAAAARHAGLRDLPTVVVTMTMVSLSSDSRLAGGSGPAWLRRMGAIVAMGSGALVAAALALHVSGAAALVAAAAIMSVGAALLWHAHRSELRLVGGDPRPAPPENPTG